MKKGLILEGGAMRGLFTAGVIDILMENNIDFDGVVGVSAGAAFGCNIKSRQIGRTVRYNMKYCNDKRYCSFHSLVTTGNLFGKEFCYKTIPEELDVFDCETFNNNPMEFYVVCTDIETGEPIYKKCDKADSEFLEWMRASASLPLISTIVEVGGYKLLDGGMADSIPIKFFENIGYDRNIVILTQPKGYVKQKEKMLFPIKLSLHKYPKMIEIIKNRPKMYNETTAYIEEKEKCGEVLVIRPKEKLPVNRTTHDPQMVKKVYEIGRSVGEENLQKIKEFLKN